MSPPLPPEFLAAPIAHRALHDKAAGRPENSRAAIEAAVARGYGIEIDVRPTRDGVAMVFHDRELERLTGRPGRLEDLTQAEIAKIPLLGSDEPAPTLSECLEIVGGRVPLLIEIKDRDERMDPIDGVVEQAVAEALAGYAGPVAVMSFAPNSIARMAEIAPSVPRGLTTCGFPPEDWPDTPSERLDALRAIPDFDRVGASFISHEIVDLASPRVAELKAQGVPILAWTIRSPEDEARARQVADNVTFEGYAATLPSP